MTQTLRAYIDIVPARVEGDTYVLMLGASLSAAGFSKSADGYYECTFPLATSYESKRANLYSAIGAQTVPADTIVTVELSPAKATFIASS